MEWKAWSRARALVERLAEVASSFQYRLSDFCRLRLAASLFLVADKSSPDSFWQVSHPVEGQRLLNHNRPQRKKVLALRAAATRKRFSPNPRAIGRECARAKSSSSRPVYPDR